MKIGQVVRVKIREERKNGAHDVYAEGIVNGIVPEYGHTTYIISNAKIIGDFKTRTPLPCTPQLKSTRKQSRKVSKLVEQK